MKNKFLVAAFFVLFSQATCWAGIGNLTGKQFIDLSTKFLIIFFLCFVLPMGIAFYLMNKRFVTRYPVLQGHYYWSLLFFPLFIIAILGVSLIYSFNIYSIASELLGSIQPTLIVLISLGLFIFSIFLQYKIIQLLLNWDDNSCKTISRDILIMAILPPVNLLIGNCFSFNVYEVLFGSVWTMILVEVMFGGLLWLCVKKTLTQIDQNITQQTSSYSTASQSYYEVPQSLRPKSKESKPKESGTEQLLKLKEMFDEGLISQKDFEKMKNEIINKNN